MVRQQEATLLYTRLGSGLTNATSTRLVAQEVLDELCGAINASIVLSFRFRIDACTKPLILCAKKTYAVLT